MNPTVDPGREKVERADETFRESQDAVIDDPTVFVKSAALGALTTIELAKLGAERAGHPALRDYAGRVRRTQESLLSRLRTVAGRQSLDVPTTLVFADEERLAGAPDGDAAAFDAWFEKQARAEAFKATDLFAVARRMSDRRLADFAREQLPLLERDRDALAALPGGGRTVP